MELTDTQKSTLKTRANGAAIKLLNQIYADTGHAHYDSYYEMLYSLNYHCMARRLERRLNGLKPDEISVTDELPDTADLEKRLEEAEANCAAYEEKIQQLTIALEQADSQNQALQQQLKESQSQAAAAPSAELTQKVQELQSQLAKATHGGAEMNAEFQKLRTFREHIEALLEQVQQEIGAVGQ